jgi:uncharacterized protein (DUF2267 family)
MNELANLVSQRTGLSQQDALNAVTAVIDILKQRLPAPLASHLEAILSGNTSELGAEAGELLKGALGGLFGGKK